METPLHEITLPHLKRLSRREEELLRLIACGYINKEIATILRLTCRTVEIYRAKLMLKLNIHTLPGLVKYAVKHGISSIDEYRPLVNPLSNYIPTKDELLVARKEKALHKI